MRLCSSCTMTIAIVKLLFSLFLRMAAGDVGDAFPLAAPSADRGESVVCSDASQLAASQDKSTSLIRDPILRDAFNNVFHGASASQPGASSTDSTSTSRVEQNVLEDIPAWYQRIGHSVVQEIFGLR